VPCAHTIETVCGGVRLCCARSRSDAVRNRASSSLSRDCRGGVFCSSAVSGAVSAVTQQFDDVAVRVIAAFAMQCVFSSVSAAEQATFKRPRTFGSAASSAVPSIVLHRFETDSGVLRGVVDARP